MTEPAHPLGARPFGFDVRKGSSGTRTVQTEDRSTKMEILHHRIEKMLFGIPLLTLDRESKTEIPG